ncbi:hypothetical protein GCM10009601_24600 [Streptomyces thermospinosisporus]|uniref:Uncharacterized protein n=1 Tax=Streptomyces thermospinosisporus TaxID=161482 RepID=A0ABN1YVQ6_9ACTN
MIMLTFRSGTDTLSCPSRLKCLVCSRRGQTAACPWASSARPAEEVRITRKALLESPGNAAASSLAPPGNPNRTSSHVPGSSNEMGTRGCGLSADPTVPWWTVSARAEAELSPRRSKGMTVTRDRAGAGAGTDTGGLAYSTVASCPESRADRSLCVITRGVSAPGIAPFGRESVGAMRGCRSFVGLTGV